MRHKTFSDSSEWETVSCLERRKSPQNQSGSVTWFPIASGHLTLCWKLKFGLYHFVCKTHFHLKLPSDIWMLGSPFCISHARPVSLTDTLRPSKKEIQGGRVVCNQDYIKPKSAFIIKKYRNSRFPWFKKMFTFIYVNRLHETGYFDIS